MLTYAWTAEPHESDRKAENELGYDLSFRRTMEDREFDPRNGYSGSGLLRAAGERRRKGQRSRSWHHPMSCPIACCILTLSDVNFESSESVLWFATTQASICSEV